MMTDDFFVIAFFKQTDQLHGSLVDSCLDLIWFQMFINCTSTLYRGEGTPGLKYVTGLMQNTNQWCKQLDDSEKNTKNLLAPASLQHQLTTPYPSVK